MNKFAEQQRKKLSGAFPNIGPKQGEDMRARINQEYIDMSKYEKDYLRDPDYGYDPKTGEFDGDVQNIQEMTEILKTNPEALEKGTPRAEEDRMFYANKYRQLEAMINDEIQPFLKKKDYAGARKVRAKHNDRLRFFNNMAGSPFSD
jgi:hypothetical protein